MEKCVGSYFYKNHQLMPASSFEQQLTDISNCIYEVIRVINGIPLFWEQHMHRLNKSIAPKLLSCDFSSSDIMKPFKELATVNNIANGNIKLLIKSSSGHALNQWDLFLYFIPHQYPKTRDYKEGVKAILFRAERANPNIKATNVDLRSVIAEQLELRFAYEALLVDPMGMITEGSRSNIFWVKDQRLYTAPNNRILPGITREAIVQICMEKNYPLIETEVSLNQLPQMDAVFLTGTSPKVLPVRINEDQVFVSATHPLVQEIMKAYDKMIDNYLKHFR